MELIELLRRESRIRPQVLVALTILSALATVVVIATVSMASELASQGQVSLRLAALFLVATALYAAVQNALMSGFAREVEGIIHRIRQAIFGDIRESDLAMLRQVGRAPLFAAITQHTQTISRNLPLLVIGCQQLVLVVFICLYLAFLSLPAFVLSAVFCAVIVWVHLARMKVLGVETERVQEDEGRLFEGLGGLLHGLKEVRMSAARGEALVSDLARISDESRDAKTALKARWAREFAMVQLAFYALLGVMVFVVPLFTENFHAVAFPGTMAALFLIGPVGTVATAIPAIDEAERALQAIRKLEARLRDAIGHTAPPAADGHVAGVTVTATAAPLAARTVAMVRMGFAYPGSHGERGFAVGPLSASFQAGQLTFITGGNGSGKSTMMLLLTGLMRPDSGHLLVDGEALTPARSQAWRDCIASVFADYHLFSRLYGVAPAALARVPAMLAQLGLADKVTLRDGAFSTQDLSAGQRKRLALIAALLEDKPVLILDEWAADQDPHFRAVFYEELLPALRAQGKMIICVTHDDRWFGMADQVLHMSEGRLQAVARG